MSFNQELLKIQESIVFRNDLTDRHIAATAEAYNLQARMYAIEMEWNPRWEKSMVGSEGGEKGPFMLFLGFLRSSGDQRIVVDAGCGTGKATELLVNEQITVIAFDNSEGMLQEATSRVPGVKFILADVRQDLSQLLVDHNLTKKVDGIFCNSALTHIRKRDMNDVFSHFASILKPGGILFTGLKYTRDGRIFMDEKIGRPRYFTTYSEAELNLVKRIAALNNMQLILDYDHPHSFSDKPMWRELFFRTKNGK